MTDRRTQLEDLLDKSTTVWDQHYEKMTGADFAAWSRERRQIEDALAALPAVKSTEQPKSPLEKARAELDNVRSIDSARGAGTDDSSPATKRGSGGKRKRRSSGSNRGS